jgi:hypothetical protein
MLCGRFEEQAFEVVVHPLYFSAVGMLVIILLSRGFFFKKRGEKKGKEKEKRGEKRS